MAVSVYSGVLLVRLAIVSWRLLYLLVALILDIDIDCLLIMEWNHQDIEMWALSSFPVLPNRVFIGHKSARTESLGD